MGWASDSRFRGFPMSNVISIGKNKEKTEKKDEEKDTTETSMEEIAKKNQANEERLRKERLQANKSVLRSYRIKH
jgi:hypothetical protein